MFLLQCIKDWVTSGLLWVSVAKISMILFMPEVLFTVARPINYSARVCQRLSSKGGGNTVICPSECNGMV